MNDEYFDDNKDYKSRSQMKREMKALQELGEGLVALSPGQLAGIDMPDKLRMAVEEVRNIKKHEARRRQIQFIGRLMRDIDPAPIREALDRLREGRKEDAARFQLVESLRDRLVAGDNDALDEVIALAPDADIQRIRQLARNAAKEAEKSKPPKSSRMLFRYLRELVGSEDGEGQETEGGDKGA